MIERSSCGYDVLDLEAGDHAIDIAALTTGDDGGGAVDPRKMLMRRNIGGPRFSIFR